MSVKITDNTVEIVRAADVAQNVFIRNAGTFMIDTARPITPYKKGYLSRSPVVQVLGKSGKVRWIKEYAAPQEVGRIKGSVIRNYTTPGTGAHFAERAAKKTVEATSKLAVSARLI